jgi:hypothetical protein
MAYRYASQTLRLTRGDTQPTTMLQLFNESSGDAYDLSAYDTATEYPLLTLYALGAPTVPILTVDLTVTDAVNGWCSLVWDTDLSELDAGQYGAQVQLTTGSGTVVVTTVDRHLKIVLMDPVGP